MSNRTRRRAIIADLLDAGPIPSQDVLVDRLAQRGIKATQATLSRDLRQLGAAKGPAGYTIPDASAISAARDHSELEAALREHALSIVTAASLVVIKTGPGRAQIIAVLLDRTPPGGMVGSIAGDDTIFVASSSDSKAIQLSAHLANMAGLS
jgi:transcriptional regulator of arginine metabolism